MAFGLATALSCASSAAFGETAWERYLSYPSPENAERVLLLQYESGALPARYLLRAHLEILRQEVVAGDAAALGLATRLLWREEDEELERQLASILAWAVRAQTRLFLVEMAALRPSDMFLRSVLVEAGPPSRSVAAYEVNMRRRALADVADPELEEIRDRCLGIIGPPRRGIFLPASSHKWSRLSEDVYVHPAGTRSVDFPSFYPQGLFAWPPRSEIDLQTREVGWSGVILAGVMSLMADGLEAPVALSRLDVFEIPKGVKHRLSCTGSDTCVFYGAYADPRNKVAAWVPDAKTEPRSLGPSLLELESELRASKVVRHNEHPMSISSTLPWAAGFVSLRRYPSGTTRMGVTHLMGCYGLVLAGSVRIEVEEEWSDPLGARSYFAVPSFSRNRLSCESAQCVVLGEACGS